MDNLFGLDRAALGAVLEAAGARPFHAAQAYSWLYAKRVRSLAAMTTLDKTVRAKLAATHAVEWPEVAQKQRSMDGTVKYLFALHDGPTIEAVHIPELRRRTMCISTQAGCPLKCAFCLTGISGYKRNLKVGEILGQVATLMADSPARSEPWNIVFMGMGEPLLNIEATLASLRILMDAEGFAVAPRRITLSTVGILPALEKLMAEPVRPNLAISLHAPNAALRRELMPIEDKYSLADVIAAAARYRAPGSGAVTYEYVLLRGVNDSVAHARELARLLTRANHRCKVNLIPLNGARDIPFAAPLRRSVDAFSDTLLRSKIPVSVRKPRGQDILAACGQLHFEKPQGGATAASAAGTPAPATAL
jgi:23S rRNA (adenine2503-C2)-methyltransferase